LSQGTYILVTNGVNTVNSSCVADGIKTRDFQVLSLGILTLLLERTLSRKYRQSGNERQ